MNTYGQSSISQEERVYVDSLLSIRLGMYGIKLKDLMKLTAEQRKYVSDKMIQNNTKDTYDKFKLSQTLIAEGATNINEPFVYFAISSFDHEFKDGDVLYVKKNSDAIYIMIKENGENKHVGYVSSEYVHRLMDLLDSNERIARFDERSNKGYF